MYIFYTGIGARRDGRHTVRQFLRIMNKHFKLECALRNKTRKCGVKQFVQFSGAEVHQARAGEP